MAVRAIATGSETGTTARIPETSSRPSVIIERACVRALSLCPRRPCVSALASPRRVAVVLRLAQLWPRVAAAVRGAGALVAAGFVGGGRPSCCVAAVSCCAAAVSWLLCAAAFYRYVSMQTLRLQNWECPKADACKWSTLRIPGDSLCLSAHACARRGRMNLACRHTSLADASGTPRP